MAARRMAVIYEVWPLQVKNAEGRPCGIAKPARQGGITPADGHSACKSGYFTHSSHGAAREGLLFEHERFAI